MPVNTSAFQHDKTDGHDEWLTPKYITDGLGPFDLDPCAPIVRPWETAAKYYTVQNNGLISPWSGRIWCNPPYGNVAQKFMKLMAEHGNGIALTFARTDTKMFHEWIFPYASAILFLKGRLTFCTVDGKEASMPSGAPSVLIAYGANNAAKLLDWKYGKENQPGYYVKLRDE